LTVLFCDLVGSTELARRLDPEDLLEIIKAYQAAAAAVVRRFDGYVAQPLGDGLMIYFGYPRAHEDDAERAVRTGLGILAAIAELNPQLQRERKVKLSARIGIDTGLVVVGWVGVPDRREFLALGDSPNVAAWLKDVAKPDTVVISQETRHLVGGYFDLTNLGPHAVKGAGQAAPVYQVLRETPMRTRLDAVGSAGLTPLVGRETEMRLLLDSWEKSKQGSGQVVLLGGEAGIGKSRLVRVLQERVLAEDTNTWLTPCRASLYSKNTAFHPVVDLLERVVLQFEQADSAAQKLHKLEQWLAQSGMPLTDAVPLFAELLSLSLDAGRAEPPAGRVDTKQALLPEPELKKLRTKEALLQLLVARASVQPVLLVLEDLHWADPSTLELLDLVVQSVTQLRILVVLTFRPEEFNPPKKGAWTSSSVAAVTLNRLSRESSERIATWSAGGTPLPESLLQQVLGRAGGNPLFIEELSKLVRESGLVREAELTGPLPTLAIPATLRGSLTARLDRMAGAKAVAQLGAMLGREFSYEVLSAVSNMEDQALKQALAQLVEAEMLYQSSLPSSRYVFKHALIQEAAYDAILKSSRQDQHRRIAEVLTQKFPDLIEKQPELIAHHYTEGDLSDRAVGYWQRAGQRALARAANVEAIAHLERALEFTLAQPPSDARDKQELELLMGLLAAYMAIKGWASHEVERTCRRAGVLAEKFNDFMCSYGSHWGLWTNAFLRGRLGEALQTGQRVLQLAPDNRMFQVMARHAVGYSHFYRGEFAAVRQHAEPALHPEVDMEVERQIVRAFQFSSSAALRIMLGSSLWMLGYPDRAPALVQAGIDLTRELKHHPSEAFALAASLLLHAYNLDVDGTAEAAQALRRLAKQENFEIWTPFAKMFNGWVRVERGDAVQGIEETREGIREWQATGSYLNQTITMGMLALALWKAGKADEALHTLNAEIAASEEREELQFAPELHRLKAEILLERAQVAESEASFERARTLAKQQGARMLELRATTSLGRLFEQTGRADMARKMLEEVYDTFTEGFATRDLREARVLLGRLGAQRHQGSNEKQASA
jgi:predicted ATPase/class 3 adenylate cyclase